MQSSGLSVTPAFQHSTPLSSGPCLPLTCVPGPQGRASADLCSTPQLPCSLRNDRWLLWAHFSTFPCSPGLKFSCEGWHERTPTICGAAARSEREGSASGSSHSQEHFKNVSVLIRDGSQFQPPCPARRSSVNEGPGLGVRERDCRAEAPSAITSLINVVIYRPLAFLIYYLPGWAGREPAAPGSMNN